MNRKPFFFVISIFVVLLLVLGGCTSGSPATTSASNRNQQVRLEVFAAASLTEALHAIVQRYEQQHPEVQIELTLDSSGTLKKQIEAGAPCDLFISAAKKQMEELQGQNTREGKSMIRANRVVPLLQNQVVLVVSRGNPAAIHSFQELATVPDIKIALGNADVPVGQYSEELFRNLGIWEQIQNHVTFGSNVKEVTTWVREGVVSCGVVYATDAFSANLETVAVAQKDWIQTPVLYPAGIIQTGEQPEAAEQFLDYLQGSEAEKEFSAVGFTRP